MIPVIIGVDIAKTKFDVARLAESTYRHAKFENTSEGLARFVAWLTAFGEAPALICMEATGAYSRVGRAKASRCPTFHNRCRAPVPDLL